MGMGYGYVESQAWRMNMKTENINEKYPYTCETKIPVILDHCKTACRAGSNSGSISPGSFANPVTTFSKQGCRRWLHVVNTRNINGSQSFVHFPGAGVEGMALKASPIMDSAILVCDSSLLLQQGFGPSRQHICVGVVVKTPFHMRLKNDSFSKYLPEEICSSAPSGISARFLF